jgi:hypothetical protein
MANRISEKVLTDYTDKAGVGGSTPFRATNCFAANKSTQQIPFPLSSIEAFSACFHWPQVNPLDLLEKLRLGNPNIRQQQLPQIP